MIVLFIITPKLGLADQTDDQLDGYVQDKLDALTGNTNYPVTVPTVADVQKSLDDYRTKLAIASTRAKGSALNKNAARTLLQQKTTTLALDCATRAGGDLSMYQTTHFDYRQRGGQVPPLSVPQNFHFIFTKYEDELKAACNKVKHESTYEFRLTLDPTKAEKDWELAITSTSAKVIFTGLESGKRYYGVVRAIGARKKLSGWSDRADKICP